MASFAALAFWNYYNRAHEAPSATSARQNVNARRVGYRLMWRTLHEEYTPSFSSFFGRGEERSCAFFTAIRAEPPAAPEPSVPPAPGAAGTRPAAPMAGEPCWIPALSAIICTESRRDARPGRFLQMSGLFHKRRIRHGAHPYFQFLTVGPFSSARGLEWERPIALPFRGEVERNATICSKNSRSNVVSTPNHGPFKQPEAIRGAVHNIYYDHIKILTYNS